MFIHIKKTIPFTVKTTLLLFLERLWQSTDTLFQFEGTMTWIMNRVVLGQEVLNIFTKGSDVFLHSPWLESSVQIEEKGDCISKDTMGGEEEFASNSHCSVTLWFTFTLLDGNTVKVVPAEIYSSCN